MKRQVITISSMFLILLVFTIFSQTSNKRQELNVSPPESVPKMVKQAIELAECAQAGKAIATLKKVISLAPNYLKAHSEYIRVKTYLLEKYDEVRAEYESLMAREPDNPVYPMALAMAQSLTTGKKMMTWFEKVAELAPDWAWGHYAQAALWSDKEPEKAAAELLKCIEEDPTEIQPYYMLMFIQADKLGKIDDAISTAKKMVAQPELRADGLVALWQFH